MGKVQEQGLPSEERLKSQHEKQLGLGNAKNKQYPTKISNDGYCSVKFSGPERTQRENSRQGEGN